MLGNVLWQAGKPAEAEAEYRQALAIDQKLVDDHPGVPELRVRLAGSHEALGGLMSQTGKPGEAEAEYRRGLAVLRKIAENDPTNPRYRYFLAEGQNQLGEWLWGANKPAEAEAEFGEALAIQQKLADDNPMDPQYPDRTGQDDDQDREVAPGGGALGPSGQRLPPGRRDHGTAA